MPVMPMFPLGSVLLPGAPLSLHVFEPRYRALVRDCLSAPEPEFGVVMIERGSEVGGGDQRAAVGTVARMVQVAELDDGRFAVICIGTRRIRVVSWLPDDPYPIAQVEEWPDEWSGRVEAEGAFWSQADGIGRRIRRAAALANELGDVTGDLAGAGVVDPAGDVVGTSYLLAAMSLAGPADLAALLAASGPVARLDRLEQVIGDIEALLQFRLAHDDPTPFET
jgi:uncharacterized protein